DAGGHARHAASGGARIIDVKERAVEDTGDGIELVIEVGEGAALAGDVDEVRHAPVQEEPPGARHLEHVPQAGRLLDVTALRPRLLTPGGQLDAGPQSPLGSLGRTRSEERRVGKE